MFSEIQADDRILIAYVPVPSDYLLILQQGWYRIPAKYAPKGIHAEWIAFYFGSSFGDDKFAIHTYARNMGHELTYRIDLLPNEPNHPRANDPYYKLQLGAVIELPRPIINMSWKRILFAHTTGDRFCTAMVLSDLFVKGDGLVNRAETVLKETPSTPYWIPQTD